MGVVPPADTVTGVLDPLTVNPALLVTVVVTVFVEHPDDVAHPGPVHSPVLEIDPDADAGTDTANDTDTDPPAGTPGEIVHVTVEPDTDA
jgi:hypothetical protein